MARRTNLNNYINMSNSNIYDEEPFIKTIRPKKTLRYNNTFSHDNYNNDDYININYYYVEEPILAQRY